MHRTKELLWGVLLASALGACAKDKPVRGQHEASAQSQAGTAQHDAGARAWNEPNERASPATGSVGGAGVEQPLRQEAWAKDGSGWEHDEAAADDNEANRLSSEDRVSSTQDKTPGDMTRTTTMSADGTTASATVADSRPRADTVADSRPRADTPSAGQSGTSPAPVVPEDTPNGAKLTAADQGNSKQDLGITQRIREALVANDGLSFTAKNVKIITVGGRVTLRGPVRNNKERLAIDAAARNVAGKGQVDNQLVVTN